MSRIRETGICFAPGRVILRASSVMMLPLLAAASLVSADGGERCSDAGYRDSYACRQAIVTYGPGFDPAGLSRRHPGLVVIGLIPQLNQAWIEAPPGSDVQQLIEQLTAPPPLGEPGVRSAERNGEYVSPECRQLNAPILDARATSPATLPLQPAVAAIHAFPDASFGAGVVVAVLDTGIDRSHPALAEARFLPGIDRVSGGNAGDFGNGIDEDSNGVVDDGFGHGTAVAGLIHAVAPGATLLSVKVLDDECRGTAFALALGVVQAVDRGARIVNASLGSREKSDAVGQAFRYAAAHGVLVVAAAGNLGAQARVEDEDEGEDRMEVQFPASHVTSLAVAAVNTAFVADPRSVYGRKVKLSAPGIDVIAPWRSGYARVSGTSFASALVSGAAATALARHPWLNRSGLTRLLRDTAMPIDGWNPGREGLLGSGVPAVDVLAGKCVPRPRTALPILPPEPAETRSPGEAEAPPED